MFREQVKLINYSIRIFDLALTAVCFFAACLVRSTGFMGDVFTVFGASRTVGPASGYYWALLIILPLWALLLHGFGMYDSMRTKTYPAVAVIVIKSVVLGFVLLGVSVYFVEKEFARSLLVIFIVFNLAALLGEKMILRFLQRYFRSRGFNYRNIIIVGTSKRAVKFGKLIEEHAGWGLKLVGFVTGLTDQVPHVGLPVLGGVEDIVKIVDDNVIDEVFFVVPYEEVKGIQDAIWYCEEVGVKVHITADFFNLLFSRTSVENFQGIPLLASSPVPERVLPLLVKRIADLLMSGFMLLVLSPFLFIVAVLIKLTSRGPVFFAQIRSGLNGRTFKLYKFRTMRMDAEKFRDQLEAMNEMDGPVFKIKNDPRITWLGRKLRKFSIDELPQLWNVLKGDMSLVGPRPLPLYEVERFRSRWQRRRLSMKPGLTCLWQVNGRNRIVDFDEWMELDLEYIDNWSVGLDMKILLKTIPTVLFARGAS